MKSISVFMALLLLTTQTISIAARPSDVRIADLDESVLILDESALDEAMMELNVLDEFLSGNPGVTYSDLESSESSLIVGIKDTASPLGMDSENEPPLGVPSFLWGCILGVVGIILVYIITDGDKIETKKALWGMLVWVGIIIIAYGVSAATWSFL